MSDPDRQYQDIADLNPDAFIIQVEERVVYCNQSARRMFRDSESVRLIGLDAIQLVDPDFRDFVLKQRNRVLSTGEPAPYTETRHLRLDGTSFPSEMVVGHVTWGGRAGTMNIIHDITLRKEAQEALKESEERFRTVLDSIPSPIFLKDTEGRYLFANKAFEERIGITFGDMAGKTYQDLRFSKEAIARAHLAVEREVRDTREVIERELPIRRPDGTTGTGLVVKFPVFGAAGDLIAVGSSINTDITERKRVEGALRESEARFRTLVEHAPEAITMLDVDTGLYLDANPMAEALHGLPRDELIGKIGPADLSPDFQPDGRSSSEAAPVYLNRALAGEFPRFEWTHLSADGQETLCEVSLARLPDPHRKLIRASISDITERKRVEEALRESEGRFRDFAQASSDWFWETDPEGKLSWTSGVSDIEKWRSFESAIGNTREEIAGDLVSETDWRPYQKALRERSEFKDFEFSYAGIDRSARYARISGKPLFGKNGEYLGHRGVASNITEFKQAETALRQSEERLREIINGLPLALHVWTPDDRLVMVNKTHLEWWPEHTEAMRPGAHFSEHVRVNAETDAVEGAEGRVEEYIEERLEKFHSSPDGATEVQLVNSRWLHVINNRQADGTTVQLHVDITQERERELKLHQAQKMEAVGQLAGGTAHEINNLLQPIITFAKLTRDEVEDPELQDNLDRVLECGRRAKEIVVDILTFARKISGKPEAIEVTELMTATVRFVRPLIPSTIELRSEISTDTGQVLINRTEFTQVIINLVQNAADAIDRAGTISITTKIVDLEGHRAIQRDLRDGRFCRVSVKDTGSGMTAKTLKRVFEPFFTTKPTGKGTGLGLSVVYGIVTGWGGNVSAGSVVGEGSVFDVYIPLMQEHAIPSGGLRHDAHTDR